MRQILFVITTLIIVLFITSTTSCTKENNLEMFFWALTKCASEPWETSNNTEDEIKLTVINYLKDEDIEVNTIEIEFDKNLHQSCEACICNSGDKIIVTLLDEGDNIKIEALGFKKI